MSIFGLIEENMELSHIHLAVTVFGLDFSSKKTSSYQIWFIMFFIKRPNSD
jgi:hypothetical protein